LDYARQGDAIVVVGIDRLGRNAAEVLMTVRDLGDKATHGFPFEMAEGGGSAIKTGISIAALDTHGKIRAA